MPMIDVYAARGTFSDPHALAQNLAAAVMRWEQVPDLPLFANNTAAFIHEMDAAAISNVAGDSTYVRFQVLTPIGVLDREKQLGVVKELTEIVATAAGGNFELVEDGYCGRLFPPGDVAMLVRLLAGYVADPSLRQAHAMAARRVAVERFSLDTMVTKYQEIYLDL